MSDNKDSVSHTIIVALVLCLLFSVVVSTAAVVLQPRQAENKALDLNASILRAAGLIDVSASRSEIKEKMSLITTVFVDLKTGDVVTEHPVTGQPLDDKYKVSAALKDKAQTIELTEDPAGIKKLERVSRVYLYQEEGALKKMILPIRGYGLWSTLYGFVALEPDLNTISSLEFYAHAETPGLGGEVDNPKWKAQWPGKKVHDADGLAIQVTKAGQVDLSSNYEVDGLAGATLTTKGIDNLVRFWLGSAGFAGFLEQYETSGGTL